MTVQELVNYLNYKMAHGVSPEAQCKVFDPETEEMQPITGSVHDADMIAFHCDID